jgi:hypothetical protein
LHQKIVFSKQKTETGEEDEDIFIIEKDGGSSCAICLIDYEEGDEISFSHNPACQHFFHRPCVLSWLRSHDACPCCRQDYLSFGDDDGEEGEENQTGEENTSGPDDENETRNTQLDHRLYGMEDLENSTASINFGSAVENGESSEPWDIRLERNMERLRRQVEDRAQAARNQIQEIRERRDTRRRHRDEEDDEEEEEGRLEQSIQLLRSQLARVREAAKREIENRRNRDRSITRTPSRSNISRRGREDRLDDAIQVVRSRLEDIATSGPANRLRQRSTRTVQSFMKHASKLRR